MSRRASIRTSVDAEDRKSFPWIRVPAWGTLLLWAVLAASMSSRTHLVMGYVTIPAGPPSVEPLLASDASWLFVLMLGLLWIALFHRLHRQRMDVVRPALCALALALLPLLMSLYRVAFPPSQPQYWEPLWLSAWSGVSFAILGCGLQRDFLASKHWRASFGLTSLLAGLAAVWWYSQSVAYHANYLLGYNDFGHFARRVASTADGHGWLVESPVLPTFWDHFNPGLMLLVPLWSLAPTVHLLFAIQAISLTLGALLIWAIAARLQFGPVNATIWSAAWLVQPALGQMNLAYTYGWHPISLAIPLLLAAVWALMADRKWLALTAVVMAMSMEEGVIVIVSLFSLGCSLQCWWLRGQADERVLGIAMTPWLVCFVTTAISFGLVYRFSGIAEFQTGRFVALGNSAAEVMLSPILRPAAFWGQIFRWDKAAFLLSLWLPCYLVSLFRGWRWLLPMAIPLMVLIVWDHQPATCLAFQYASALLPIFWLAVLSSSRHNPTVAGCGALATGLVHSLFVGQMPYSSPSLLDVVGRTYGAESDSRRMSDAEDGQWLTKQVAKVRQEGSEVLATGRIAAHLLTNRDVETVGQYLERRQQLADLADRRGNPIAHYAWCILDRRERFQQETSQTAAVEAEARAAGFMVVAEAHGIVLLENPK